MLLMKEPNDHIATFEGDIFLKILALDNIIIAEADQLCSTFFRAEDPDVVIVGKRGQPAGNCKPLEYIDPAVKQRTGPGLFTLPRI